MKYDNRTGRFRGFACVKFKEEASAQAAVDQTMRFRIQGRRINIAYSKKRRPKTNTNPNRTGDETCWFCFNNKDIKRHLILNVGRELYIALPKEPV